MGGQSGWCGWSGGWWDGWCTGKEWGEWQGGWCCGGCDGDGAVCLLKINFLTKFQVLKKIIDLRKDLKYEHQSGWVGGLVGGFMVWVVGWVVVGFMVGWVWWCGTWWGGWLEDSWGGCIYSPTHEQLQCQNISFYENPPTHQTYPKCHSITVHILTHT